jgi:ribosomal-protein-alanine N-acetyltransferase
MIRTPGWPAVLRERIPAGVVMLRPLQLRDGTAWMRVRERNVSWLAPWEATPPLPGEAPAGAFASGPASYLAMVRSLRRQARRGQALPFSVFLDDTLVGQLTVAGIARGSLLGGHVGYWIDERYAGRGITPTAVAMAVDHCFGPIGLHRIEVNVRPENAQSRRVAEKLGFREEGLRRAYLHIDGAWRDHVAYALTAEEVPHGLLARWRATQRAAGEEMC